MRKKKDSAAPLSTSQHLVHIHSIKFPRLCCKDWFGFGICFSLPTKCPHTKIQEPSLIPLPLELFLFLITHQAFVSLWLLDINIVFHFYRHYLPYDSFISLIQSPSQPGFQSSSPARIHVFTSHSSIHRTVMTSVHDPCPWMPVSPSRRWRQ